MAPLQKLRNNVRTPLSGGPYRDRLGIASAASRFTQSGGKKKKRKKKKATSRSSRKKVRKKKQVKEGLTMGDSNVGAGLPPVRRRGKRLPPGFTVRPPGM